LEPASRRLIASGSSFIDQIIPAPDFRTDILCQTAGTTHVPVFFAPVLDLVVLHRVAGAAQRLWTPFPNVL